MCTSDSWSRVGLCPAPGFRPGPSLSRYVVSNSAMTWRIRGEGPFESALVADERDVSEFWTDVGAAVVALSRRVGDARPAQCARHMALEVACMGSLNAGGRPGDMTVRSDQDTTVR